MVKTASIAGGMGLIPGGVIKLPPAMWCCQKKKERKKETKKETKKEREFPKIVVLKST